MRLWLIALLYTLAFLAGLATFWVVTTQGVPQVIYGRTNSLFVMVLVPLWAALAVFALVYGLATRQALKWEFWLLAPLGMAVFACAVPNLVVAGYVTVFEGIVISCLLIFVTGLVLSLWRDAGSTPEGGMS